MELLGTSVEGYSAQASTFYVRSKLLVQQNITAVHYDVIVLQVNVIDLVFYSELSIFASHFSGGWSQSTIILLFPNQEQIVTCK